MRCSLIVKNSNHNKPIRNIPTGTIIYLDTNYSKSNSMEYIRTDVVKRYDSRGNECLYQAYRVHIGIVTFCKCRKRYNRNITLEFGWF